MRCGVNALQRRQRDAEYRQKIIHKQGEKQVITENQNVLLTIEYDGTHFSGWQRQPGKRTVQGELERALSELCRSQIKLNGTSRTDAGVHALGQRASFTASFGIPVERIPAAANNILMGNRLAGTGDVRIISAETVPPEFHARFSARGKKYVYRIRCAEKPDVFLRNYRYQITKKLDINAMREAAMHIEGTHDFRCFQAAGGEEKESTVRTIYRIDICEEGENEIALEVCGDGFLYNMVRIITGTLVETGLGKRKPHTLADIIAGRSRQSAGHTAPPQGLYLAEVYYDFL